MVEVSDSKNATLGAFSPPEQREGARKVQLPEATAIADNLADPTKYKKRGDLPPLHSSLNLFRHQRLIGLDTHPNPVYPDRLRPHPATPLQPAPLRKLQMRPMTLLPPEPFANS